MKKHFIRNILMTPVVTMYAAQALGHTNGPHSGGLLEQLVHILTSTDHLFIVLSLLVVVSLLVREVIKNRD